MGLFIGAMLMSIVLRSMGATVIGTFLFIFGVLCVFVGCHMSLEKEKEKKK